jgi:hypothetical protein
VAANKIQLQLAQLLPIDADVGQLAKASVDTVDGPILLDNAFNDSSGSLNTHPRIMVECYLLSPVCNVRNLLES